MTRKHLRDCALVEGVSAVTGWGVGGPSRSYVTRAGEFTLGPVKIDGLVAGFESQMLIAAAHAEGSLNTSTEFHLLANPGPPSLAGHRFVNTMQPLADTILAWLSDQKL